VGIKKLQDMSKTKFYLPALLVFGAVNAQTPTEQEKIKSTYDYNSIELLQAEINQNQKEVQQRINNYLAENPSQKEFFTKNGVSYRIFDILDGKPVYQSTDNNSSARAIKTNHLYPGGSLGLSLEGEGMNIGVWDGGWILATHTEFMNGAVSRVTVQETSNPNPSSDQHGTHVGGTVGARGANPAAKGMAPKSSIKSYNWTNDEAEVTNEASTNALLISNHSYGTPIYNNDGVMQVQPWYMGAYSADARTWDQILYNHPYYLMVASAGNSGTDNYTGGLAAGLDKLTGNKNAKNNLVIANANPTVHPVQGITALSINPTSSQGPSDDGRIKPDIAADGSAVFSTNNESATSYVTLSGTSMASPSVAGTLLLLQEHYNDLHPTEYMRASTLKGLVIHTAVDDYEFNSDFTPKGPDPRFGWGMLDAREAALLLTNSVSENPTAVVQELELNGDNPTYTFQVRVINPKTLKATICWTDVAGTAINNQLNSTTPALVNNLDLRITKDGETFYPWKFDLSNLNVAVKGDNNVDNVERVDVDDAVGIYTIEVSHKGTLSGGSQKYSLIISGFDTLSLSTDSFEFTDFVIYPNPAETVLNFKATNSDITFDKVEMFDAIGKKVLSTTVINNSIDISQLNAGVYFVKVHSSDKQITKKIIKK